jgi:hypothetical protein
MNPLRWMKSLMRKRPLMREFGLFFSVVVEIKRGRRPRRRAPPPPRKRRPTWEGEVV